MLRRETLNSLLTTLPNSHTLSPSILQPLQTALETQLRQVLNYAQILASVRNSRVTPSTLKSALRALHYPNTIITNTKLPGIEMLNEYEPIQTPEGILFVQKSQTISPSQLWKQEFQNEKEMKLSIHYLAINGKIPCIPQNVEEEGQKLQPKTHYATTSEKESIVIQSRPLFSHTLSAEQQSFISKLFAALQSDDMIVQTAALLSLRKSTDLHSILPYLVQFICENSLKTLSDRMNAIFALHALLKSPFVALEAYLHLLLPAMMTCIVNDSAPKRQDNLEEFNEVDEFFLVNSELKYSLQQIASECLRLIIEKFSHLYPHLRSKTCKLLLSGLLDPSRGLICHNGCILALNAMGNSIDLLPLLRSYMELIEVISVSESAIQQSEARRIYDTIKNLVSVCAQKEKLKITKSIENEFGKYLSGEFEVIEDDKEHDERMKDKSMQNSQSNKLISSNISSESLKPALNLIQISIVRHANEKMDNEFIQLCEYYQDTLFDNLRPVLESFTKSSYQDIYTTFM